MNINYLLPSNVDPDLRTILMYLRMHMPRSHTSFEVSLTLLLISDYGSLSGAPVGDLSPLVHQTVVIINVIVIDEMSWTYHTDIIL